MSEKTVKAEAPAETGGLRPVGLTFASVFFIAAGLYYLLFPFLVGDSTVMLLVAPLGGLSLLGGLGVMLMNRWGLWLGLLSFPLQTIANAMALQVILQSSGLNQNLEAIAFAVLAIALLFLGTLSFLFVVDKRKSFK